MVSRVVYQACAVFHHQVFVVISLPRGGAFEHRVRSGRLACRDLHSASLLE